ncbi:hypothetical protein KJE20_08778 [Pyrenophora tritici-repentis]|nr:hypothetical protein Ptr86124_004096 [Pyrenophora tritici-repentis]KAI1681907.1 hypothetical protein KJE20_08778 [Pyrenophora tritici-repentis]
MASSDTDEITAANQRNSPFLRLPAEIRRTIYTYICSSMIINRMV